MPKTRNRLTDHEKTMQILNSQFAHDIAEAFKFLLSHPVGVAFFMVPTIGVVANTLAKEGPVHDALYHANQFIMDATKIMVISPMMGSLIGLGEKAVGGYFGQKS